MGGLWERLVAAGLLRDLLSTAIAVVTGHAVLIRPWRAHRRTQKLIADRLDASTPGGLGDMAKIINTGAPLSVDATTAGHAAPTSTDTHPSDHPKATSGGGGTK